MKQKICSRALPVLLALILIIGLLPTTAFAAGMPEYSGGTGTEEDPWLISSVDDLKKLADTINSGEAADFDADAAAGGSGVAGNYYGYYFKQTCDLDLSAIANWEPIGYSGSYYFAGNYDGGNYTILNMTSTGKNDEDGYATAGLFGWVAFGSVSNVHVEHADLKATGQGNYSYAGGITGIVYGSSITNCSVSDSVIESARDKNNNCAGGITGYSAGGTFESCAAEGNTIKTMAYGGGFVGEADDDYGAGTTSFANCYVANSTVTAFTEEVQGLSFAGEFAGEMTVGTLTLENCFVYNNTAAIGEGSAPPSLKKTGVFVADTWNSAINATNCYYYTKEESPVNTGDAKAKSVDEFADGTVTALLGSAFINGTEYPIIGTFPADYTKVDAAIEEAGLLNKEEYKNYNAVEDAINAVVRGKTIAEQATVDSYVEAIENAINALEYRDADYTKVDEAIAKAEALNKDNYKDFSGVEAAISAVIRDKNITEQAEVDAMAKAIEAAIANLEKKPTTETSADTDTSTGGNQTGDTTSPETGDSSNMMVWVALLTASGAALLALGVYTKKRRFVKR